MGRQAVSRSFRAAQRDLKVFGSRQIFKRAKSEMFEESLTRAIEQRATQTLGSPHDRDQRPLLQVAQDAGCADATHLLYFQTADRLSVRYYCQRFEGSTREPVRTRDRIESLQVTGELRPREYLITITERVYLKGSILSFVFNPQLVDGPLYIGGTELSARSRDLCRRQRRLAGEQNRLNYLRRLHS